ncbi:hypothetical protein CU098_013794, partial [Rhizopus stolonifer]
MVLLPSALSSITLLALFTSATQALKTCTVAKSSTDDALTIVDAFKTCASGGNVVFTKGTTYTLKTFVKVTGLKDVNVQFYGTVKLPEFNTKYKNTDAYFRIEGSNINWDGGRVGTFQGNGQKWWDSNNRNSPTTLYMVADNSVFKNFGIESSPRYHMELSESKNVTIEGINIHTVSSSSNVPHNTDALDVYNSVDITFRDTVITNGDDCLSLKNNITNVIATNITCTNGHGFSIGSLGKGDSWDFVSKVQISDSVCTNCQNGVRIKTWPGGHGAVKDVTFDNIKLNNVDNPLVVTTHYCDNAAKKFCNGNDNVSLPISGITFKDIQGSASNVGKPVISIDCATQTPCSGFTLTNVSIKPGRKSKANVCKNL